MSVMLKAAPLVTTLVTEKPSMVTPEALTVKTAMPAVRLVPCTFDSAGPANARPETGAPACAPFNVRPVSVAGTLTFSL